MNAMNIMAMKEGGQLEQDGTSKAILRTAQFSIGKLPYTTGLPHFFLC